MHARMRLLAACFTLVSLTGCAVGQRLGWTASRAEPTDRVRASCEEATRTLKGGPDYDTALGACLQAKTRQHLGG